MIRKHISLLLSFCLLLASNSFAMDFWRDRGPRSAGKGTSIDRMGKTSSTRLSKGDIILGIKKRVTLENMGATPDMFTETTKKDGTIVLTLKAGNSTKLNAVDRKGNAIKGATFKSSSSQGGVKVHIPLNGDVKVFVSQKTANLNEDLRSAKGKDKLLGKIQRDAPQFQLKASTKKNPLAGTDIVKGPRFEGPKGDIAVTFKLIPLNKNGDNITHSLQRIGGNTATQPTPRFRPANPFVGLRADANGIFTLTKENRSKLRPQARMGLTRLAQKLSQSPLGNDQIIAQVITTHLDGNATGRTPDLTFSGGNISGSFVPQISSPQRAAIIKGVSENPLIINTVSLDQLSKPVTKGGITTVRINLSGADQKKIKVGMRVDLEVQGNVKETVIGKVTAIKYEQKWNRADGAYEVFDGIIVSFPQKQSSANFSQKFTGGIKIKNNQGTTLVASIGSTMPRSPRLIQQLKTVLPGMTINKETISPTVLDTKLFVHGFSDGVNAVSINVAGKTIDLPAGRNDVFSYAFLDKGSLNKMSFKSVVKNSLLEFNQTADQPNFSQQTLKGSFLKKIVNNKVSGLTNLKVAILSSGKIKPLTPSMMKNFSDNSYYRIRSFKQPNPQGYLFIDTREDINRPIDPSPFLD